MRLARTAWLLAWVFALGACGPESGVGASGDYVFLPGAPVVDTVPYPLRHQLQVEQDDDLGVSLVYLFSGELGTAGLGLPDLRRLARDFNGFQMAFERPRSSYLGTVLFSVPALGVALSDGSARLLHILDDDTLRPTGASRFLGAVDSDDYLVRAYFAPIESSDDLPTLAIDLSPGTLTLTPQLPATPLSVELSEDALQLDYGTSTADYLIVELVQIIHSKEEPNQPIEAMVRTSMLPGTVYAAGAALLTSAASQGCWSTQRPLLLRVTQVRRDYMPMPNGDSAVVHQRSSSITLDPKAWVPLVAEFEPASYCSRYD